MTAPYDHEGARYLFACTAETDRVLITSGYRPELYYAAGRGFAAGRLYYLNSLAPSPEFKAFSLDRLRAERVPIALMDPEDSRVHGRVPRAVPVLQQHYRAAGQVEFWDDRFDVLVDARIPPTGTWAQRLPCYGEAGLKTRNRVYLLPRVHGLALHRVGAELHQLDLHAAEVVHACELRPRRREPRIAHRRAPLAQTGDGRVEASVFDAEMRDAGC